MPFADYANSQAEILDSPKERRTSSIGWSSSSSRRRCSTCLSIARGPAMKEFKGATHRRKLMRKSYNRIKKFGASQKCTLDSCDRLLPDASLLSRLSGQDDIVVGIPNRGPVTVGRRGFLVGHCVNFIPLRGRLSGNPSTTEFPGAQMKQTVLAGYEHQNYTYGRLVRKLALRRDPSRLPITEVQFNLERVGGARWLQRGWRPRSDPNPKSFVNFDIFLNIMESKDGLTLDCDYNTGLLRRGGRSGVGSSTTRLLLEGMTGRGRWPVSVLPLLRHPRSTAV